MLVVDGMIHPGPQDDDVQRSGYAFENTTKNNISICIIIMLLLIFYNYVYIRETLR